MQTIIYDISQVIGVAIIHSLWQGLLVFLVLRILLLLFPGLPAAVKHNLAFAALVIITGWFVYTISREVTIYSWIILKSDQKNILTQILSVPVHGRRALSYSARYYYTIEGLLPYITLIYLTGLLFNTGKLLWAHNKINGIRQNMSIDFQLQLKVAEFVNKLNIPQKVQFGLSKLVDVPCVTGYFKPVILLPFTLSTYLSAEEIEIIILHELAHIKRNDYLINLAQQAMRVLLFFNPFAQLISRTINSERENSCDDIVIEATQKPLVYAHALLKLEKTRRHEWQLALAVTGKKYHLLNRIERIMKTKKPVGNTRHILLSIALLTASITGLAWLNPTIANGKISINKIKPHIIRAILSDTAAKKTAVAAKPAAAKKAVKTKTTHTYTYDHSYTAYNDPQLDKLSEEVNKYSEAIGKYYDGPEMRKLQEDMEKKNSEMETFYNSPHLKQLQDEMEKKNAEFEKMNNNPEILRMQEQMQKMGSDLQKYYENPQYKKMEKEIVQKAAALGKLKYDSPQYKKQSDQLNELSKRLEDHNQSSAIKQQQEEIRKTGESISSYYNSPEYAKLRDAVRIYGDSIHKLFRSPQLAQQQEDIRKLSAQMRDMQNNPEIKKQKEQMQQAISRMHAYMNSPAYRNRMEKYKKDYSEAYRERKERPEKPETQEKSEAPEKHEAPEKRQPADTNINF